jgi:hypothetical protein
MGCGCGRGTFSNLTLMHVGRTRIEFPLAPARNRAAPLATGLVNQPNLLVRLGHDIDAADAEIDNFKETGGLLTERGVLDNLLAGVVQPLYPATFNV